MTNQKYYLGYCTGCRQSMPVTYAQAVKPLADQRCPYCTAKHEENLRTSKGDTDDK